MKLFYNLFAKKLDSVNFTNRERFSSGIFSLDYIYGETKCIDSLGNPIMNNGYQITYSGMPTSFISVWGGMPGVGKSRLAIAVCKEINKLGKEILYFNGEAEENEFRSWVGVSPNLDKFLIYSNNFGMDDVEELALKHKTDIIFIDSFQRMAGKQKENLDRLINLKNNKEAGLPHIVLISQMNKAGKIYGKNDLSHMADFVALITKSITGNSREFCFECLSKNRAGATPRGAYFEHEDSRIKYLNFKDYG